MLINNKVLAVFGGFILIPLPAGADDYSCPTTFSVQQTATNIPPQWSVGYSDFPLTLNRVMFYDGPPTDMASLVYDKQESRAGERIATWHFAKSANPSGNFWMECGYAHTTTQLSRAIPKNIRTCSVVYNKLESVEGQYVIKSVICK